MKIAFHDAGAVASVTITSSVFEFRKHNRVVNTVMHCTPEVRARRAGFFSLKTVLTSKSKYALRAYKNALREAAR